MSAETKLELLGLIDGAVAEGWAHLRACAVLDLADVRAHRWRARLRDTGSLQDKDPGGGAVHGLLSWEEAEILDLIEEWARSIARIARSRTAAAAWGWCSSHLPRCCASRLRTRSRCPGEQYRPRPLMPALPQSPWERNRIWIWDATHFPRAGRVAYAIVGVVTRYWIGYLLTGEQTSTQAQLLFAQALEDQQLLDAGVRVPAPEDHGMPVLIAWSDNGSEMTALDTRNFMAFMAVTQHHGRPGTPTDQAHIESFFSHLKGDWPHLTTIREAAVLDAELARVRRDYNAVRLHAAIGYVTPDDEHHGRGPRIRPRPCRGPTSRTRQPDRGESSQPIMTTLPDTDHAGSLLGMRALLRGFARWPGMAREMGTDDARTPATNQSRRSAQRVVEKSAALSRTQKHRTLPRSKLPGRRPTQPWLSNRILLGPPRRWGIARDGFAGLAGTSEADVLLSHQHLLLNNDHAA